MLDQGIISIFLVGNVLLLGFSALRLFPKRHIINFLVALAVAALLIAEIGKIALIFNLGFYDKLLGVGFFLTILSSKWWLLILLSLINSVSISSHSFPVQISMGSNQHVKGIPS